MGRSEGRRSPRIRRQSNLTAILVSVGVLAIAGAAVFMVVVTKKKTENTADSDSNSAKGNDDTGNSSRPKTETSGTIRERTPSTSDSRDTTLESKNDKKDQDEKPQGKKPFQMLPCDTCSGTGKLHGEVAIEALARMKAETETAEIDRARKLINGQGMTKEEREKFFKDSYEMHLQLVRFEAKRAQANGRELIATCPACDGSKWRSSAEK